MSTVSGREDSLQPRSTGSCPAAVAVNVESGTNWRAEQTVGGGTQAGLAAARARGRKGGRKPKMTPS